MDQIEKGSFPTNIGLIYLKIIVVLKLNDKVPEDGIDDTNMTELLIFQEMTKDTLTHMYGMFTHIF